MAAVSTESSELLPVCLLTGASGQLGEALCRALSGHYRIAGVFRSHLPRVASQMQKWVDPLDTQRSVSENARPIFAINADLVLDKALEDVVEATLNKYARIDVLINNAAYAVWDGFTTNRLWNSADGQFRVNAIVPFKLAALIVRRCWQDGHAENTRRNRNIINVSSMAGTKIYPGLGQSLYASSKAALTHLTFHMAMDLKEQGIRVNAVAPNSFPSIVSINSVVNTIVGLIDGQTTGDVRLIDTVADY